MKNIILIDIDCMMIDSISKSKEIYIDTLIVGSDKQKEEIEKIYKLNNILSAESINKFYTDNNIDLDYSIIEKYRHTQLKVEHFFSRKTTDINSIQYIYYSALSYWIDRFQQNNIDAVFSAGIEFGSTFDTIIYDVAKYNNKKVVIMEVSLNNGTSIANQVFDYTNKKYLKVNAKENGLKILKIDDFLYNSVIAKNNNNFQSFKGFLQKTPEKYGGFLIVMFASLLLGKYKSIHHSFNTSYWAYFRNYFYSKKLLKYYNSLSVEFDRTKKYVYYSLHMEPEASTLVRTIFSNQLVIIKTLSQSLPNGWILYVKEHPHQFTKLNNFSRYFYLSSIDKFKTKRYYDEIVKLKNVKLLNINQQSNDVIKYSQAVVTINGTVVIEAVNINKPILMFSQYTSPLVKIDGIININTSTECKCYFDRIKIKKDDNLKYTNFGIIVSEYMFEVSRNRQFDYVNLVKSLIKEK